MMKNKFSSLKTFICITVLSLLACASLCGCGRHDDTQVREQTEKTKIAFSWWGNDPRHQYTMLGVDLFMEKNPDIRVDYKYGIWNGYETRNKVYMNSHTEPDVMQINYNWLSQYSPDGNGYYDLYNLKDYIDLSVYSDSDLAFGEINGKLNAVPIAYNSTVVFYNKDIYDKYGLEIPKTWDDLFDAAKVMRDDGIYQLGAAKKHVFMMLLAYYEQMSGEPAFAEDGSCNLDSEGLQYILEFYKKLVVEKVLMPIDQFDRNKLSSGELAGSIFWISDINNYCASIEAAGTPVLGSYLSINASDEVTGWYKKPATMYAISAYTDNPEASAKLLDFLINDPEMARYQGTEKGIPVSSKALQAVEEAGLLEGYSVEANNQMIEASDELKVMIPIMEDENLIDIIKSGADAYIYDKETVDEVIYDIIHELQLADTGSMEGISAMLTDYYQDRKDVGGDIAYLTGTSQMNDGNYNQTIYDGIRMYANSAGVSYSYYLAQDDSAASYKTAIDEAIEAGCRIIVSSGVHFDVLIGEYQDIYPDIAFLMIDGVPEDGKGNPVDIHKNVHCISFKEEQSGYMAGYLAVMEGYRRLGFIGGEEDDSIKRYGYGYLQGISDAAKDYKCSDEIKIDYWYADSFMPNDDTYEMALEWYEGGTQIIFCCGGALYESVLRAANKTDTMIIGVDVDQSDVSPRVLTSAIKGVDHAVVVALDSYFAYEEWPEDLAGQKTIYGLSDWCGGLPTIEWRFENVTLDDYYKLYSEIRNGDRTVIDETDKLPKVNVKIVDYD